MAGNAIKAMVAFFTICKQDITSEDMDAMDEKFHLVPVVGAMIGLVVMIEAVILAELSTHGIIGSPMFSAAIILATVYVGSRFLHFDGLADFGDGSVVAGTREDHVRALKDTLIGAGGLGVALIVTLISFSEYAMAGAYLIILAPMAEILLKNAQVSTAAFGFPSDGMAGKQVSCTSTPSLLRSSIISFVLCLVFGLAAVFITGEVYSWIAVGYGDALILALVGTIMSIVSGYLIARHSNRVFGMVNGDILGTSHEIARVVVMLSFLIVYGALA